MPVTPKEQAQIQVLVDASNPRAIAELRSNAERALLDANHIAGRKFLSRDERKTTDLAIEVLTRIDAKEQGGGWWFRTKRRAQLVQMYFGS